MAAVTELYPARCPLCGARATDALASSPGVPIYACGSTGLRSVHVRLVAEAPNVTELTDDEAAEWWELSHAIAVAATPARVPSVGLCACGATAIDGACMDHVAAGYVMARARGTEVVPHG